MKFTCGGPKCGGKEKDKRYFGRKKTGERYKTCNVCRDYVQRSRNKESKGECERCKQIKKLTMFKEIMLCRDCLNLDHPQPVKSAHSCALAFT